MSGDFRPAVGVLVHYERYIGTINHINEDYLTLCISPRCDGMVSDVCLVIHKEDWSSIDLLKRSER